MYIPKCYPNHSRLVSFWSVLWVVVFYLAGCSTTTIPEKSSRQSDKQGKYYLDDGPETNPAANLDAVADAVPRAEPLRRANMKSYVVLSKTYHPMTELVPHKARGTASWYGKRFHGKKTASGEIYDMYAMTAAHPTLPIPSYVRVTRLQNGKSIIVRINDRGPFLHNRLIDLSYVAAHKLDMLADGHALVEVEVILPGQSPAYHATAQKTQPGTASTRPDEREEIYLQVAAFSAQGNARNYLDQFQSQLDSELKTLTHLSRIHETDGLYKVLIGPFADEASARQIASTLSDSTGTRLLILK
ncbi:MAG: septal ring lytic transglycosylase RlpA family protein [Nitrosomonas sp.]|nr:septal ring lytic transglycosylase RlpA family protein [Nitrosomonas sp.]